VRGTYPQLYSANFNQGEDAMFIEKPRFSCPLGGAMATVGALPRAIPILHASQGCGGNSNGAIMAAAGHLGSGYCGGASVPATGINEKQVVFGGIERLEEQIRSTIEVIDGDLFIIITGCTAEIIGDDVEAAIRAFHEEDPSRPPLLHASGAGFKGNSYFGYDSVLQSVFNGYVEKKSTKVKGKVNVWGIPPALDVFWEGNLIEIRRLLEGVGLEVNTFFTKSDSLEAIKNCGDAELNIVFSPLNGIAAAEVFKEVHGTDYIVSDLPIGAKASIEFLHLLAKRLKLDHKKLASFVNVEKDLYYHYFSRISDSYCDMDLQRYAVIVGDTSYALALSRFAEQELGWLPKLVAITDPLNEDQQPAIRERFLHTLADSGKSVVFETDTSQISKRLYEKWPQPDGTRYYRPFSPAFVIGSRLDKDFADKIGAGHLSVSYPISNRVVLSRGYAGFKGGLNLIEDILSVVLQAR